MRAILARTTSQTIVAGDGKWKQLGIVIELPRIVKPCFVVGRYEDWDTGGCDTIKSPRLLYELIEEKHKANYHVLFEGLFVMNHTLGVELATRVKREFAVCHLDTPWGECKQSVNERRARKGQGPLEDWHNTENHVVRAKNFAFKVKQVGAQTFNVSRDTVAPTILRLLGDSNAD